MRFRFASPVNRARRGGNMLLTLSFAAATLVPRIAGAEVNLSGDWEIQSMGGDRTVRIQQKSGKVMVHREMWPEFEGEKYKLEHLYRGTLAAGSIKGQLLVREDGKGKYDVLRKFSGRVISGAKIEIDSYIVKRTGGGGAAAVAPRPEPTTTAPARPATPPRPAAPASPPPRPTAPKPPKAPPAPPRAHRATPPPPAPSTPPPPATPPPRAAPGQPVSLFDSIMATPGMRDLFAVEARDIPPEARRLTAEADAYFRKGNYRAALARYQAANEVDGARGVDLLFSMGRCYSRLREWADARRILGRALRLDPNNGAIRDAYKAAKRGR